MQVHQRRNTPSRYTTRVSSQKQETQLVSPNAPNSTTTINNVPKMTVKELVSKHKSRDPCSEKDTRKEMRYERLGRTESIYGT